MHQATCGRHMMALFYDKQIDCELIYRLPTPPSHLSPIESVDNERCTSFHMVQLRQPSCRDIDRHSTALLGDKQVDCNFIGDRPRSSASPQPSPAGSHKSISSAPPAPSSAQPAPSPQQQAADPSGGFGFITQSDEGATPQQAPPAADEGGLSFGGGDGGTHSFSRALFWNFHINVSAHTMLQGC